MLLAIIAIGLLLQGALGFSESPSREFDFSKHNVPLEHILSGGPSKDGIPAILNPAFVSASDAGFLDVQDRVLGVVEGDEAKAYPIKILNWHEIVNDRLGGKPVLVTYCPLCGSGIGFDPVVNGRLLTFGVSGLLYQSDMVMYDHQTESLWSQISMEAIAGSMTGTKLHHLFLEHTTWSEWQQRYPGTLVLSTKTGHHRDYDRDPYLGYAQRADLMVPLKQPDSRFHSKEWVLGLEVEGSFKAYPFSELEKVDSPLLDHIHGQPVRIHYQARAHSVSVTDQEGTPLPSVMAFWFAWSIFHPEMDVFIVEE
ncbi:MAG: DUF3179 domain-containing protein [Nitrospirales bacterium]|nr:DUF3179 domain-containing protein [Nitrospirales bacterium]